MEIGINYITCRFVVVRGKRDTVMIMRHAIHRVVHDVYAASTRS